MASLHAAILSPLCVFTFFFSLPMAICDATENDRQALLCFKSELSDPSRALTSWSNASLEFCSWHGVTCSALPPRRVIVLDLQSQGIAGSISPCVANLTSLTSLQLSNNSLHGAIPPELGLLNQLISLNLSKNSLEGNIPSELSACSRLQILALWDNSLSGEIPPSLSQCKHLQEIDIGNNKLQGSIPSALGDLAELRKLVLASNSFSGDIPWSLGSSQSLTYVDFGSNALTGRIPELLANSSSLQVLRLMSNRLSGEIPKAIFNSSTLIAICLQENSFFGFLPPVTATSPSVKYIDLGGNYLSGTIPPSLGNLSSLVELYLTRNKLFGGIPESFAHFPALQIMNLNLNNLSGPIPTSLFNISSLTFLAIANNSLVGRLPRDIGYTLPNIQYLILTGNDFGGPFPASLVNAYHLKFLYLAKNRLTGFIPFFGSMPNLEKLDVSYNMLEAGDWGFISSLSNCSKLIRLVLDGNGLQGNLPSSIGNLSTSLEVLFLRNNGISGPVPPEIGNLKSLSRLYMDYNLFTGHIPSTVGNLRNLAALVLAQNRLSGQIPDNIGNLARLNYLKLDGNNLSGRIPASIGGCTQLTILNLAHNSLYGNIPDVIFKISSLSEELDFSHNYLSGEIPKQVGNLIHLKKLGISNNRLSGSISSTLGQCVALEYLQMQNNLFVGSIPQSFVNLISIKKMDISQNNLSGKIPELLANLSSLQDLNLSFNNFDGAVPRGGVFDSVGAVPIEGNGHLCTSVPTGGMPLCSAQVDKKRKHKSVVLLLEILLPISVVITVILSIVATIFWRKRIQENPQLQHINEYTKRISYEDIARATDSFSSANLIGSGSSGMVYKGTLKFQEDQVAIKIFNLDGADRSFISECEALRNARHRNLVRIITSCSSVDSTRSDFKALVFQYMPNGNLQRWLHPKPKDHEDTENNNILTLRQRINVGLDIAFALDYLHNQCAPPLIHCDLKPSNILLDLDMVAYVTDFGLARFLVTRSNAYQDSSTSLAGLKGSIGYIPPEYGISREISTNGDVYSFGVLLLEMITGCGPTDEKFSDGTSLHKFVDRAIHKNINEVVDPTMLQDNSNTTEVMKNCVIPLARIGLSCSMTSPKERPEMDQVCTEIIKIKHMASHMSVN